MMISVVIPTYNERDNVQELLERLENAFSRTDDSEFEVIIVDDDSPDGTAEVARGIGEALGINLRVIVRTSDPDLSRSVVRGFREATGQVLVVMDADLQHPPERVPALAAIVTRETPIAIGTRYASGGRIENWSTFRKIVSYGALALAKILVPPTRGLSDPISGFFALHTEALCIDDLSPDGYKILVEVLATVDPNEVKELGYVFRSRDEGETSLDLEQYHRFLKHSIICGFKYRLTKLLGV